MIFTQQIKTPKSIFALVGALLIAANLSGCYLFKKKKKSRGDSTFIIHDSISFKRNKSSLTTSDLNFQLRGDGNCELRVWPQEEDMTLALQSTSPRPCSNVASAAHKEAFSDLRTDTLYAVEIAAWGSGSSSKDAERFVAYETREDGLGRSLVLIDANLPQQVLKSTSIKPDHVSLADAYRSRKPAEGCVASQNNTAQPSIYEQPTNAIEALSLSGHITAETFNDNDPSLLPFNGLIPDATLHAKIRYNGGSEELKTQAFGRLTSLKITEPEATDIPISSQQAYIDSTVPIGAGEALNLNWLATQMSPQSFIKIAVDENAVDGKGFACFFHANAMSAKIPFLPYLNDLKPGLHQIVVSFVYQTVSVFNASSVWIVSAYDWHSFRIERI